MSLHFSLICLILVISTVSCEQAPEFKTNQGALRGKYLQSWKGRKFSAFTGIPYAQPPVGLLRFSAPVPALSWHDILDASKRPSACPQMDVYVNNLTITGDEDCLYLNVFTPQLTNENKKTLPVLFYIHGGGWMTGSSFLYGPEILLDKDVVLVTINYRLGPLGFLCTGDEIVPGNNGLKDQNLALKWVKKYIENFGGNPKQVTVFGQSAGGASTHYHMISPLSKNLLHRAIAHSGTALAPWALSQNGEVVDNTKKLAKLLECPTTSSKDIVNCLRKIEAKDIVKQDTQFSEWCYDPMIPFKPVIEPFIEGAFLSEDPIDIIKSGKAANIPLSVGFTSEDGALKTAGVYNDSTLVQEFNDGFLRLAPYIFSYHNSASNKDYISQKIRDFYFGEQQVDESTVEEVTKMMTDGWFLLPSHAAIALHYKYYTEPVYYYLFAYRGSTSYSEIFGNPNVDYGVCHCDELLYLFVNPALEDKYKPNEYDKQMIDLMTTLWTNFARTGNPTPEKDSLIGAQQWEAIHSNKLEYYHIKNARDARMNAYLYMDRATFWNNLPLDSRRHKLKDEL